MSDEQQKEKRPLSMTRRYRRGLVIVGLLCMMVTLAIATVLFQRSYTVRVDKYPSLTKTGAGPCAQPLSVMRLLPRCRGPKQAASRRKSPAGRYSGRGISRTAAQISRCRHA